MQIHEIKEGIMSRFLGTRSERNKHESKIKDKRLTKFSKTNQIRVNN